jgi:starvation-inducible DNA-binding protein
LLADVFTLYLKTKNFHWHMSGSHFRDYHLLLDEHGEQLFAMTDDIAETGQEAWRDHAPLNRRHLASPKTKGQRFRVTAPHSMVAELCDDNGHLTQSLRSAHELCEKHSDVATASLIETWIDETERRVWFLSEIEIGANAETPRTQI